MTNLLLFCTPPPHPILFFFENNKPNSNSYCLLYWEKLQGRNNMPRVEGRKEGRKEGYTLPL
jgi:hypothetical protein